MPLYEYCCPSCKLKFELLRTMSKANEDAQCPKCSHDAGRVLSKFASFTKGADGLSTPIAGSSGCGGCSSSSCTSCNG